MDPKLIREARARKRLTQAQLGKIVGVVDSQISRFENGTRTPRIHEAERLATALDIPVSEIPVRGAEWPSNSPQAPPTSCKTSKSMLALPEGTAIIEFPASLSAYSRKALEQWLELMRDLVNHENL